MKMYKLRLIAPFLTAVILAVGAGVAPTSSQAATITTVGGVTEESCSTDNFTVSIACNGDFTVSSQGGNVSGSDLDPLFFADGLGISGWTLIDQAETSDNGGTFDGVNNLFTISTDADNSSGTWSLIDPFKFSLSSYYIFTLKGATEQVAYFMDGLTFLGLWNNTDLGYINPGNQFTIAGLSNIRLFEAQMSPIPIPAAGLLLITALGGLGFIARRRKTA